MEYLLYYFLKGNTIYENIFLVLSGLGFVNLFVIIFFFNKKTNLEKVLRGIILIINLMNFVVFTIVSIACAIYNIN